MTEREKMVGCLLYTPTDEELERLSTFARQSSAKFNNTDDTEKEKRQQILKDLLGSIGTNVQMSPYISFDYGCNTYIGNDCIFNFNCTILDCAEVRFGNNVLVGPNSAFLTPVHPYLSRERNYKTDENGKKYILLYSKPINIEDNVWLGGGVTVNPGVTIGHDTIIGSGSVVTKDIPSGVIAAGNPCRVIREITEEDTVENIDFNI